MERVKFQSCEPCSRVWLQVVAVKLLCQDECHRGMCAMQVVESMRRGLSPTEAAEDAVRRIASRLPTYVGALIAVDKEGQIGAAAYGWTFKYSYRDATMDDVRVVTVEPLMLEERPAKINIQSD